MNDITIRLFFFSRDDKNYITSNPTLYSCAQTYVTVLYRTPMIDSMYKKNHRWDRPRSLIHWNIAVLFKSPHGGGGGRPIMIICQIKKRYIYISISRACAVVLEETEEEEEGDVVFWLGWDVSVQREIGMEVGRSGWGGGGPLTVSKFTTRAGCSRGFSRHPSVALNSKISKWFNCKVVQFK